MKPLPWKIALFAILALNWYGMPANGQGFTPDILKPLRPENPDTVTVTSVKDFFSQGKLHGHVRNFFMTTVNHGPLSDHYANAIGAKIGYQSASFHGFRLGFSGLFTFNLFSSGIDRPDPVTGKYPRLELELFDVQHPGNRTDLDRLDELYLEYGSARFRSQIGRFSFTSPLINPQDGRMKPYTVQGFQVQVPLHQKNLLTLAWIDHFSPRSTVSWFRAAETIGIYPAGVNEHGDPSGYAYQLSSKGVGVAGLQLDLHQRVKAEGWNFWIDNISNTSYSRTVAEVAPGLKVGVEGLYQFQVGNGGNQEPAFAYFPDQEQWLMGGMVGYEPNRWRFSLNYLHVGKGGRFLFPREWGREQFFVTVPRGRIEGTGKTDLLVAKTTRRWLETFTSEAALVKSWLPAPDDFRHNKYGAEGYWGWVMDMNYQPTQPKLKGMVFRLLYVGRLSPGTDLALHKRFYNTNFHNLNFVTQLNF
jgi:hypothetical protein